MAGRKAPRGLVLSLGLCMLALLAGFVHPAAAAEPSGYEYFHTYAETEAAIDKVVRDHPDIAQKFSIGKSYEGREIWALKLTQDVSGPTEGKPEVMINGLMHARERASSELAIYMFQVLANNYGLSGRLGNRVTRILNSTVVYVIPMMNPDGAEYDFADGRFHKWRKNRQPTPDPSYTGIDLNRQFGYTWNCCGGSSANPANDYYHGTSAWQAPEVRAYRDFVQTRVVNGSQRLTEILSLHSAAKQVLWPYSYTKQDVPSDMTTDDHAAFVALGNGVAKRNGYKPQQGSDLYIVDGDQDDWAYGAQGIFALTIEMKKGYPKRYYPTLSQLNKDLSRNRGAVLWFLEQAGCPHAAAGLEGKHCGASSGASLYSQSVYDENAVQPQQTNCWCVVASTRAMLEHIDPSIAASQGDVNDFITPRDKNDWTDPSFEDYIQCSRGSPSPSYAHDSRGMAWALWRYASPDHSLGFNDYKAANQDKMNWRIVRNIRATGQPVGVIAAHGKHAILAVGYETALDPLDDQGQPNSILGMRVWDPWYNAGFGNWSGWPSGGFAPNSFVTAEDWNSKYFRPDRHEGPYYEGKYVAVLRSSVAEPPSDTPAQNYGDWVYEHNGATPAPSPDPTPSPTAASIQALSISARLAPASSVATPAFVAPAAAPTVAQAVADGLRAYDLLGDAELGNLPADYQVGTTLHVASLESDLPSYFLVELRVAGRVRAVALVDEKNGGYVFGELRATTGDLRLPTPAQMQSQLSVRGLRGAASLAWTWTENGAPPFAPFLSGTDAFGRPAFVTPSGVVKQLPTDTEITPTDK